jgi:F420-0:Gamma-glutamyl ligase.
LIESEDCEVEFVFSNDVKTILDYNTDVLTCDIHTREKTTKLLKENGANVYGLHQILVEPIGDSGFNPDYGLLGSKQSNRRKIKNYSQKTGDTLVNEVTKKLIELTGKQIEVMVYGDGAFKDPVGKIWD